MMSKTLIWLNGKKNGIMMWRADEEEDRCEGTEVLFHHEDEVTLPPHATTWMHRIIDEYKKA